MKKIYIKPRSGFPYQGTDVPFQQSVEDIKALLRKFKCDEILSHEVGDKITIAFKKEGVPYIMEFPEIYEERKNQPARLRMDISARVVYNRVKTALVDVEIDVLSFMQAMLRMVALQSPQGLVTLGEVVEAQKDNIVRGQIEFDPQKIKMIMEART